MNEYLEKVREAILKKDKSLVERLTAQYADAEVTPQEIVEFSRSFGTRLKAELRGSININGAGGSHIPKPNITSIAAMYLAAITGLRVVKTGSGVYSGLWEVQTFSENWECSIRKSEITACKGMDSPITTIWKYLPGRNINQSC